MVAITDLVDRVSDSTTGRPVIGSLASGGKAIGAPSIGLTDATNWTTSSAIHFAIYKKTASGYKDPTTQTEWKGTLAGTTISNLTLTGGTDQAYVAGDVVELTPTARYAKDIYDWGTAQHNQDGSHGAITATSLAATGAITGASLTVTGAVSANGGPIMPAGGIIPYAGSSAPSGWLITDGSAVSRTTYSALFTAIGTTYGTGDGTTTFNVPNLKGRAVTGVDSSQTEFNAVGKTGGEKTHTLTPAEMPSHQHTLRRSLSSAAGFGLVSSPSFQDEVIIGNGAGGDRNTDFAGGGGAHNNLQPYIALNYIIKT